MCSNEDPAQPKIINYLILKLCFFKKRTTGTFPDPELAAPTGGGGCQHPVLLSAELRDSGLSTVTAMWGHTVEMDQESWVSLLQLLPSLPSSAESCICRYFLFNSWKTAFDLVIQSSNLSFLDEIFALISQIQKAK